MARIVIFGTGLAAEVAHFYFTHDTPHEVVAFTVNEAYLDKRELFSLPVVPFEAVTERYPPGDCAMFIAVGYAKVNQVRARLYAEAKAKGYELASYVSSRALLWGEPTIGDNAFILELNNIQPFASIGANVVLWSGNHIGHHSRIGDHCFVASHVVISGSCSVGDYSFIGVNAALRDGIRIGRSNVIGAGALIMKDTPDDTVFTGHAARPFDKKSFELDL
ncbi:MAG TPA: acetyltransferase [Planctomycetota bacterium]|nr:acetyltransferase [Planctomycetota bacterium]